MKKIDLLDKVKSAADLAYSATQGLSDALLSSIDFEIGDKMGPDEEQILEAGGKLVTDYIGKFTETGFVVFMQVGWKTCDPCYPTGLSRISAGLISKPEDCGEFTSRSSWLMVNRLFPDKDPKNWNGAVSAVAAGAKLWLQRPSGKWWNQKFRDLPNKDQKTPPVYESKWY